LLPTVALKGENFGLVIEVTEALFEAGEFLLLEAGEFE